MKITRVACTVTIIIAYLDISRMLVSIMDPMYRSARNATAETVMLIHDLVDIRVNSIAKIRTLERKSYKEL